MSHPTQTSERPANYDMRDASYEPSCAPLQTAMAFFRELLSPAFEAADSNGLRHQRHHRQIAIFAAIVGTLAILFGAVQLLMVKLPVGDAVKEWMFRGEFIAAMFALLAVVLGIRVSLQNRWLIERHKAERLRLLKFSGLVDPLLWRKEPAARAEWRSAMTRKLEAINQITWTELQEWAEDDSLTELYQEPDQLSVAGVDLAECLGYYDDRRLSFQLEYFKRRESQLGKWDRYTRKIGPTLFFASILAVLIHFGIDLLLHHGPAQVEAALSGNWVLRASVLLVLLSTALPILSAGLRTFRGTYEFARNTSRFHAKRVALTHLQARLLTENEPKQMFYQLWLCEQVLQSEQREWLRLMIDGEWFG